MGFGIWRIFGVSPVGTISHRGEVWDFEKLRVSPMEETSDGKEGQGLVKVWVLFRKVSKGAEEV
jgi:hypothetical protein